VVVNYDFPVSTSDYLHRAGRTGRAGRQGTVYTLYHNKNLKAINELKKSNDSRKPLDVRKSAYSLINREDFKHIRQTRTAKVDKAKEKRALRTKPHKTVRFRQKIKVKRRNKD
jgi:superfamily II DNA/RNA helicase